MRTLIRFFGLLILLNFNRIALAQENSSLISSDNNQLVVLQYHHVADDTPGITSIRPKEFTEHLNYLAENGFSVVSLPDAIKKIREGKALPKQSVAITFDDGYLNLVDFALPELAKRNWPATIFVNPGLLEKHSFHYLSWQQLQDWQKKGMTIANHGWQHDYWVRQPKDVNQQEWQHKVKQSILSTEQALKQNLGTSPKLVAFPYGEYDTWLTDWLTQNGLVAFGQQSGVVSAYSDFSALPRFPASGQYANLQTLAVKLKSKALPVDYTKLPSPLVQSKTNPPTLQLNWIVNTDIKQLACYVTSQPKAHITIQGETTLISAVEPLNSGRSRYNCTLPRQDGSGDYFWFSQPWLLLN